MSVNMVNPAQASDDLSITFAYIISFVSSCGGTRLANFDFEMSQTPVENMRPQYHRRSNVTINIAACGLESVFQNALFEMLANKKLNRYSIIGAYQPRAFC